MCLHMNLSEPDEWPHTPPDEKLINVGNVAETDEISMKLHFFELYGSIVRWGAGHWQEFIKIVFGYLNYCPGALSDDC